MSAVALRCRTHFSLASGIAKPDVLCNALAEAGYVGAGICDAGTMMGVPQFVRGCADRGLKALIGCDIDVRFERGAGRVTTFAKSPEGYAALCQLVSHLTEGGIENSEFIGHCGELAVVLGFADGPMSVLGDAELAAFCGPLDDCFLEVDRTQPDASLEARVLAASEALGIPAVAGDPVFMLHARQADAVRARCAVQEGVTLDQLPATMAGVPDGRELVAVDDLKSRYRDLPEVLENACALAMKCTSDIPGKEAKLPDLGHAGEPIDRLRRALNKRVAARGATEDRYQQRLETELAVIQETGFADYFLMVSDYTDFARESGIPVGPGRGSAAGSLVAYVLGITDIDPLEHDLLFERFLTAQRVAPPDVDTDFDIERRSEVFTYIAEKYPDGHVAYISTVGTFAARAAIQDACRVMGFPATQGLALSGMVPDTLGITITKALAEGGALKRAYAQDPDVQTMIGIATAIEGSARQIGTHPAGIIVSPVPITDLAPVRHVRGQDLPSVAYDMSDVESIGLVKFDLLGLKTLTVIQAALDRIPPSQRPNFDEDPPDDADTYAMIASGETEFIFQLESAGMTALLKKVRPAELADLIVTNALYRPGPIDSGMLDAFVRRRSGDEPVSVPDPCLEPILAPTYGVVVYQEQVMQVAQVMADYTLAQADELRRAMGKKKASEMERHRALFIEGAERNGIKSTVAGDVFELCAAFAKYGFNKSHAAAYSTLAYRTAYLKRHHPKAFLSALLEVEGDKKKVPAIVACARRMGVEVLPPSVKQVERPGVLAIPLGSINGVSKDQAHEIAHAASGADSIGEMVAKLTPSTARGRTLTALADAGALDAYPGERSAKHKFFAESGGAIHAAIEAQAVGQAGLFGDGASIDINLPECAPWSHSERLRRERESVNCYVSGHPCDYAPPSEHGGTLTISDIVEATQSGAKVRGRLTALLTGVRKFRGGAGGPLLFVGLSQPGGELDGVVRGTGIDVDLQVDSVYDFEIEAEHHEDHGVRLSVLGGQALTMPDKVLEIAWPEGREDDATLKRSVMACIRACRGDTFVSVRYVVSGPVILPQQYRCETEPLREALSNKGISSNVLQIQ